MEAALERAAGQPPTAGQSPPNTNPASFKLLLGNLGERKLIIHFQAYLKFLPLPVTIHPYDSFLVGLPLPFGGPHTTHLWKSENTDQVPSCKLNRQNQNTRDAGTSLVVQWLRLCASTAEGTRSSHGWGTKIPHAARCGKKTNKQTKNKGWKEMLTILPSGFYPGYRSCTPASWGPSQSSRGPRETVWGTSNRYCDKEDEAQPSTALLPDTTNDVLKHVPHTLLIQVGTLSFVSEQPSFRVYRWDHGSTLAT